MTAPALSPDEAARVAIFDAAPVPPEVVEARVIEEVARAICESDEDGPWGEWPGHVHVVYRKYAAAAVAAYRATQDGGAEEAVRRVEKVVRCGRGYTDAEHWVDGHYACPGFASPAIAPQAGDGAR